MATVLPTFPETVFELEIRKMPDGGYLVGDGRSFDPSRFCAPRFASTSIDEAMKYIKAKLEPKAK